MTPSNEIAVRLRKNIRRHFSPQSYTAHETRRMMALEGVPLASFRARGIAILIDLCVVVFAFLICLLFIFALRGPTNLSVKFQLPDEGTPTSVEANHTEQVWLKYAVEFGIPILYWGLVTYLSKGKTVGKWIAGIRVLSTKHERLTLWQSIERALGYSISALELGFGFIQYFLVPNRQTTHDRIAETIVVREEPGFSVLAQRLQLRENITLLTRSLYQKFRSIFQHASGNNR